MACWRVFERNSTKGVILGAVIGLFACSAVAAEPGGAADAEPGDPEQVRASAATPATAGTLSIRMSGFRNADGQVLLSVFRGEAGFPSDPNRAWKKVVTRISGGRASVDIEAPPGEYAFAVVHDENSNAQVDTNWIGMPKEGIGTSNNAKGRMGPPKYRDAKFTVPAEGVVQEIRIVYL